MGFVEPRAARIWSLK